MEGNTMNNSKNTSVKKIPATLKLVEKYFGWEPNTINFDIGCGRWPDLFTEALKERSVINIPYDPYHMTDKECHQTLKKVLTNQVDTVTLNNVLNVVPDGTLRLEALLLAAGVLKSGGICYILIHEGDKKGIGRATSRGWQANKKAFYYLSEVQRCFRGIFQRGRLIIGVDPK